VICSFHLKLRNTVPKNGTAACAVKVRCERALGVGRCKPMQPPLSHAKGGAQARAAVVIVHPASQGLKRLEHGAELGEHGAVEHHHRHRQPAHLHARGMCVASSPPQ